MSLPAMPGAQIRAEALDFRLAAAVFGAYRFGV